MALKPDTYYFIKDTEDGQLQVCRTRADWYDWEEPSEFARGFGFRVLGHIDDEEFEDEYPESEFIEIPKPV